MLLFCLRLPTGANPQNLLLPRTDEVQQLAQCRALREREHKAEQAARAAETRDAAWAYTTEQKLQAMSGVESEPWSNLRSGLSGTTGYIDHWTADYTLNRQ